MRIYFDMDGVLAHFESQKNALKRFKVEKGFFQKLKPNRSNVRMVKRLIKQGHDVHILSASPNEQADYDKRKWLSKHLPQIKSHKIIFCRLGENKAKYANIKGSLLIDDYTTNLLKWRGSGGLVLKYLNKYDSPQGKHTRYEIPFTNNLKKVF